MDQKQVDGLLLKWLRDELNGCLPGAGWRTCIRYVAGDVLVWNELTKQWSITLYLRDSELQFYPITDGRRHPYPLASCSLADPGLLDWAVRQIQSHMAESLYAGDMTWPTL